MVYTRDAEVRTLCQHRDNRASESNPHKRSGMCLELGLTHKRAQYCWRRMHGAHRVVTYKILQFRNDFPSEPQDPRERILVPLELLGRAAGLVQGLDFLGRSPTRHGVVHDVPGECLGSLPKSYPIRENVATKFSVALSVSGTEFRPRQDGDLRSKAHLTENSPYATTLPMRGKTKKKSEKRI